MTQNYTRKPHISASIPRTQITDLNQRTESEKMEAKSATTFSDFPIDVQLCILSFLRPSELTSFASSSKLYLSLFRHDQRLWYAMCDRRFGSMTQVSRWGSGKINYKDLYKILDRFDNLIGFWRRSGDSESAASLVFFEWGPFYITGSRVLPGENRGYGVVKKRFLWISVSSNGEEVNYLDPDGKFALSEEEDDLFSELEANESELVRVDVNFMGKTHLVVAENCGAFGFKKAENVGVEEYGSPPDKIMSEIYQYFANRTSPGGNGQSRRQRRREKEKQGKMRKWETEHYVKIVNCSPTPCHPLQGLWKGICDDMSLGFYLVSYDDVGGIACRKVGGASNPLSYHAPVFWTSTTRFIESPFSPDEDNIYVSRLHPCPRDEAEQNLPSKNGNVSVSRMLLINSSYELVLPELAETALSPRQVEGRIWQYGNGTFGFGFLRNNYIIDLKHIAKDGELLDTVESSIT